jgi:hypothetical protein
MSRFTVSILMATALLGVLLWIVLSMARDLARAPQEPLALPTEPAADTFDPALARIGTRAELAAWLTARGYSAAALLDSRDAWLEQQGFPPGQRTAGLAGVAPAADDFNDLDGLDDADLLRLAANGNAGAFQALAEHSLQSDPLAALEWYEQAVVNGSIYAMLRLSDLLVTLSAPELENFVSDSAWQLALEKINSDSPAPRERALAWAIAAVTIGGYAIMDPSHAARIAGLGEQLDDAGIARACETGNDYVLEIATARRMRGSVVIETQAPGLALSIDEPDRAIPCSIPVLPLISLAQCNVEAFVGPGPRLMNAWICPR